MANLPIENGQFLHTHNTTGPGTYSLLLSTENKFLDKNIAISISTTAAETSENTATVSQSVNTSTGTAINIHGILSSVDDRPTANTVYYLAFDITGSGNSAITRDGWITTGTTLPSTSASATKFYTVAKATGGVSNNIGISTTVAITPNNITTTSTSNGIYIQSIGSGTASGTITASSTAAGYFPANTKIANASVNKTSSQTATTYISGVTVPNTTFTVTASSNSAGTIKVAAYASNTDSVTPTAQTIVTNGVWTTTSITPGTAEKGPYYGKTTVVGDADLKPENIRHSVNIFGVSGTFTSDGSITAGVVLKNYVGYSKGTRYVGTMANNGALNKIISTQNGTVTVTAGYYSGGTITATLPTTTVNINTWTINSSDIISANSANWEPGYIESTGNIPPVQFLNAPATGSTSANYLDLTNAKKDSNTYYIPEVNNSRYIYITKGYIDNVRIDIGRLIPDITDTVSGGISADYILSGHYAYDDAGQLLAGSISDITFPTGAVGTASGTSKGTVYVKTTDQYVIIPAGYNATAVYYKFNKTTSANYSAANIRSGKTISVSNGSSNIYSVAGTFSAASTVTSATAGITVTAAGAAQIRAGYSAFLNGQQLDGSMPNTTASTTFADTGLSKYFTTTNSGGNVTINTSYTVSTAGYISTGTVNSSTTARYNINIATFKAGTGNVVLDSDTATASIYATGNTRGIAIDNNAPTAAGKVYIKVTGSGTVSSSAAGWIEANTATNKAGTKTRYISLDLYMGAYTVTEGAS